MGHLGRDRVIELIRERFFVPNLAREVDAHLRACDRCLHYKTKPITMAPNTIIATHPMELVHLDFLQITQGQRDLKKTQNILVITDNYTRFAQAFLLPSQTSHVLAKVAYERFFSLWTAPAKIITDQAKTFDSQFFTSLCEFMGIKKIRTSPYHPQTNGQCERFNATLVQLLGTLDTVKKDFWREHIASVVSAYNTTKNSATGVTPFERLVGWPARLPVDVEFGLRPAPAEQDLGNYVERLKKRQAWIRKKAQDTYDRQVARNEDRRKRCTKQAQLRVGDEVLLKKFRRDKLEDRWERDPGTIVKVPYPGQPLYVVRLQDGSELIRHRTALHPLLCYETDDPEEGKQVTEPQGELQPQNEAKPEGVGEDSEPPTPVQETVDLRSARTDVLENWSVPDGTVSKVGEQLCTAARTSTGEWTQGMLNSLGSTLLAFLKGE